ncbi:hypothetical protein M5C90_18885 [Pseudomonas chlororaphis subsp. piscium]|nr:hypothetical protein M5C90_18885 [Pseudomonas chlororaphis subsp. piscium]
MPTPKCLDDVVDRRAQTIQFLGRPLALCALFRNLLCPACRCAAVSSALLRQGEKLLRQNNSRLFEAALGDGLAGADSVRNKDRTRQLHEPAAMRRGQGIIDACGDDAVADPDPVRGKVRVEPSCVERRFCVGVEARRRKLAQLRDEGLQRIADSAAGAGIIVGAYERLQTREQLLALIWTAELPKFADERSISADREEDGTRRLRFSSIAGLPDRSEAKDLCGHILLPNV